MALTVPTYTEYKIFVSGEEVAPDEQARIEAMLARATDALWVFTGLDSDPEDPRLARLVKYAILDLTAWLLTQDELRDEINSPFTSERIGSYSYSKMQSAKDSSNSGLYWLDLLFQYLRDLDVTTGSHSSIVTSEFVFNPGNSTFADSEIERRSRIDFGGYF